MSAPRGTAQWYRELAAFVRSLTYRTADGAPDRHTLQVCRLGEAKAVLEVAQRYGDLDQTRAYLARAVAALDLDDEAYIARLLAREEEEAERYEAKAAEIEAQQVGGGL